MAALIGRVCLRPSGVAEKIEVDSICLQSAARSRKRRCGVCGCVKKVHTTQHFLLRKNSCVALRYIALRNAGNQQLAIQITLHKTADRGGPRVQHHMSGDMSQIHVHLDSSRVTSLITTIVPCIQKNKAKISQNSYSKMCKTRYSLFTNIFYF